MENKVLIVDDEPSILKVLSLFLKKEKYSVDNASSISDTQEIKKE